MKKLPFGAASFRILPGTEPLHKAQHNGFFLSGNLSHAFSLKTLRGWPFRHLWVHGLLPTNRQFSSFQKTLSKINIHPHFLCYFQNLSFFFHQKKALSQSHHSPLKRGLKNHILTALFLPIQLPIFSFPLYAYSFSLPLIIRHLDFNLTFSLRSKRNLVNSFMHQKLKTKNLLGCLHLLILLSLPQNLTLSSPPFRI